MQNILIALIIVAIIYFLNPLYIVKNKNPLGTVDPKTKDAVNQVLNQTRQQVDYSKTLQQNEMNNIQNN